jgi:hypothetical protein
MIGGLAVVGLFARIDVAEVPAAAEQICCTAIVRFCAHKSPMPEPHLSWPASQSCHQCQVARAIRVAALRAPSGPVEASASAVRLRSLRATPPHCAPALMHAPGRRCTKTSSFSRWPGRARGAGGSILARVSTLVKTLASES